MADAIFAILAKLVCTQASFRVETWTTLRNGMYHPEQHYMRGPGPKCREKHSGVPVALPKTKSIDGCQVSMG